MNYPAGPSQEEKEIITAFCLLLNACDFCYGAHKNVCMSLGVDKKLFPQLVGDIRYGPGGWKTEAGAQIRSQTDLGAGPDDR